MKDVFDALARNRTAAPGAIAFRAGAESLTWSGLADRVSRAAAALSEAPGTIAAMLPNGLDYVVADLAVTLAGRRLVPVPVFFSAGQTAHLLRDSGAEAVIAPDPDALAGTVAAGTPAEGAGAAALPVLRPDALWGRAGARRDGDLHYGGGAMRVIYTSGSTGRPKGVLLGDGQIGAVLKGLSGAIAAGPDDRYMSVLPQSQLLEQVCGIFLPILAGGETVIVPEAAQALFGGDIAPLVAAAERHRPTTSVIAPRLLALWVAALRQAGRRAPDSLRFVAVGGAPTAMPLLQAAHEQGIPVHEGYGLSEACSVVAMNRHDDSFPGTVGRPLDGVEVTIDAGEVVVAGPSVMAGYTDGRPAAGRWHTGDLGHFDGGRLVIEGRKDNMIVTPSGRNISPEWVEALVQADPRVICAALVQDRDGLVLIVAPGARLDPAEIAGPLRTLPAYARPDRILIADPRTPGLIRPSGTPDRSVAQALAAASAGGLIPLAALDMTRQRVAR